MSIPFSSQNLTASTAADLAAALAARCAQPKATATGWQAGCPAHQDAHPSLSIDVNDAGDGVVIHCHAGCPTDAVVAAWGLTLKDLYVPTAPRVAPQRIVKVYDYIDEHNAVVHQTVRYGPVKKFKQRRPDPAKIGDYLWSVAGVELVLYHLPQVLIAVQHGETVYLCEGEKDADNVTALGLTATCNAMGAGKWEAQYTETLRGAYVALLPHNDTPGQKHTALVTQALQGSAAGLKVVELPGLAAKGDVSDWLAAGGTRAELEQLTHDTALWAPVVSPGASTSAPQPPPSIRFDLTDKDKVRVALVNVLFVLEQHPAWKDSLGFDELLNDVVLLQRPPYLDDTGPWRTRPVSEQDYREMANWLQRTYHLYVSSTLAGEGLTTYAYRHAFHPIRDYLHGLTWDDIPRLDTWLQQYCHAEDTPYGRAVGSKTLIAAVARVEQPGCKADCMPILEGPQGIGKSTVWNTLASDPWFTDWLPDLCDKDAAQTLCGKWIIEFGELSAFQRSEIEGVKRFISAKQDHYRPAYGKKAQTFPRQTIFVGSTNEDHYFKDHTGNRRFWPVQVEGEADIAGLVRDRDQLWAEAVARYRQGEAWHLTGDLAKAAVQEQAQRVELDDWEDRVIAYADSFSTLSKDRAFKYVTTADILAKEFLIENPLHWTQANTKRIGGILRRHGWKARPVWNNDNTKQFKAFTKAIPPVPPPPAGTGVTDDTDENPTTGNSESLSKDASGTCVTDVTALYTHENVEGEASHQGAQDGGYSQPSPEVPVTTGNGVTPVTDVPPSVALPAVMPPASASNGTHATQRFCTRCGEVTTHGMQGGTLVCSWCSTLPENKVFTAPDAAPPLRSDEPPCTTQAPCRICGPTVWECEGPWLICRRCQVRVPHAVEQEGD